MDSAAPGPDISNKVETSEKKIWHLKINHGGFVSLFRQLFLRSNYDWVYNLIDWRRYESLKEQNWTNMAPVSVRQIKQSSQDNGLMVDEVFIRNLG